MHKQARVVTHFMRRVLLCALQKKLEKCIQTQVAAAVITKASRQYLTRDKQTKTDAKNKDSGGKRTTNSRRNNIIRNRNLLLKRNDGLTPLRRTSRGSNSSIDNNVPPPGLPVFGGFMTGVFKANPCLCAVLPPQTSRSEAAPVTLTVLHRPFVPALKEEGTRRGRKQR
jgi:hypothetical protein